jgi:hypothetical protein
MDGTETKVDATTSPESKGTSAEPQVYVKDHVDKLLEKLKSDSLAELGRVTKASQEAIRKVTESSNARITQLIKEQEERELQTAQGNPDALNVIKEKQSHRQTKSELTKAQEELNETKVKLQELSTKTTETTRETTIREIAMKLKVDPEKLTKLAKFTDGNATAIEEIANELPKLNTNPTPKNNFRPDSGDTTGGVGKTKLQLQSDYISGKIPTELYEKQMKERGWKP